MIGISSSRIHEIHEQSRNHKFKIKSVKLLISGANESPKFQLHKPDPSAQNGTAVAPLRTDYCSFKLWQKLRNWIMQVHNPTLVQDQKANHEEGFPDNRVHTVDLLQKH